MTILGLSTGHDAGAAIIIDGKIVSAINEERLNRKKMYWGFPDLSIPECLRTTGVEPARIDAVAIAGTSSTRAKPLEFGYESVGFFRTFFAELSQTPLTGILMGTEIGTKATRKVFESSIFRGTSEIENKLKELGIMAPVHFVDHHLSHATGAYFTSGWKDCLTLTLDASGDGWCSRVYNCKDGKMKLINSIPAYHSPGFYYCYVTHLLGFIALRHEGKVTGLAAFGDPNLTKDIFAKRISYDSKKFSFVNKGGWLQAEMRILEKLLKPFSREDVAAGIQKHFEEMVSHYAVDACKKTGAKRIALSGGVFSNVKLNQEVWEKTNAEEVYIFPNMGDGGLAAGAAFEIYAKNQSSFTPYRLNDVYLGTDYTEGEIEKAIQKTGFPYKKHENVEAEIARLLADKKIVARFNGKMEYGPRALGNRSILYHCQDRTVNAWLNEQLNRTEFMPFAPVVLKEDAHEYLVNYDRSCSYAAEFMTITYGVTPKCAETAPAITHVDKTARPQIVTEEINRSYYNILKEYKKLTGHSILVNTSFNMHEEPIVRTPEEALTAFEQSKIHALAIGNFIVEVDWSKKG
jgi:carbamoyltransferase